MFVEEPWLHWVKTLPNIRLIETSQVKSSSTYLLLSSDPAEISGLLQAQPTHSLIAK